MSFVFNGIKTRFFESIKFSIIFWTIWFEENYIMEGTFCNKIAPIFSRYKKCFASNSSSLMIMRIHVMICYFVGFFAMNMTFFINYIVRTHKVAFPDIQSTLYAMSENNKDEKMKQDGFYSMVSITHSTSNKARGIFNEISKTEIYWNEVKNACFSVLITFKDQLNVII